MYVRIKPTYDSTVYSDNKYQNISNDQILELVKSTNTYYTSSNDLFNSRIFIYFDLQDISEQITNFSIPVPSTSSIAGANESEYILKMYIANSNNLQRNSNIVALYPVSSSWSQSIGYRSDIDIITEGISWYSSSTNAWYTAGGDYIDLPLYECNSVLDANGNEITDLSANVNKIVYSWYNDIIDLQNNPFNFLYNLQFGSNYYDLNDLTFKLNNYGIIVKRSLTQENDDIDYGFINFHGSKTHTIYSPVLQIGWDNSIYAYNSSSMQLYTDINPYVYLKKLNKYYHLDETSRIYCKIRDSYYNSQIPVSSSIVTVLHENSYYSIVDVDTGDVVIPYSNYSKISLDINGNNYFDINFINYNVNRIYKVCVKTLINGAYNIFDNNSTFMVID